MTKSLLQPLAEKALLILARLLYDKIAGGGKQETPRQTTQTVETKA